MANIDITSHLMSTSAGSQWQKIGIKNHRGIVVPLFSLHSANSCGIGEYPDLLNLLSWCEEIDLDVIQLLPLNDTGIDISPYSALSATALNPIHIGLSQLPHIFKYPELARQIHELQSLTASQRIFYSTIQKRKDIILRAYFRNYGSSIMANPDYDSFKEANQLWLTSYAIFKAIKIQKDWQSWELWPPIYKDPLPTLFQNVPSELATEAEFHMFLQYLCFKQLEDVKKQATEHGIFIKGDIPILVNRESASVWRRRQFFLYQLVAGAPPDMYSTEGQKWGFPLYDWDAIAAQGYNWWIQRLNIASKLYHIYRIDHIVGFYRIWGIPVSRPAKEGHFVPENGSAWIPHGETIMKVMLENCSMLPIGEDLGVVPPEVKESLRSLGICGTKVMRWERRWDEDKSYIDPKNYPPESMTTVSTHDSETLQQWWKNQSEEARLYAESQGWTYNPDLTREQRSYILRTSNHSGSLFHINLLQEYLALTSDMTWPNPDDERINIPGIISDRNWTYRFRPSIEEITNSKALKQAMLEVL